MKGIKSSFKKLFGIQNPNGLPNARDRQHHNTTLERLREMEDLLQRKQTHLEEQITAQIDLARKHGTKNKRAALMALKRKKRLEAELIRIDGTLTTIEMQREALESAKNNLQVLGAMKDAAKVLKIAQEHVTVDKVLDIMDDVNEQHEIAKEIADAVANPIGMDNSIDEAELEKELEDLEQEELNMTLLHVNEPDQATKTHDANVQLDESNNKPREAVPADKTEKEVDPDEQELQELAQWST